MVALYTHMDLPNWRSLATAKHHQSRCFPMIIPNCGSYTYLRGRGNKEGRKGGDATV